VRRIDEQLIKVHADRRFRSEYDYAMFEYYRSAKVFAFLDQAGARLGGRVLDAGCGGGGMPLSFAEEADEVVGIDLVNRFGEAGFRIARERQIRNLHFLQADGQALPFHSGTFDWVFSHAVIEHVADAHRYLRECARVLRPGGRVVLLCLDRHEEHEISAAYGLLHPGFSPRKLRALLQEAGLEVLRAEIACKEARKPHLRVVLAEAEKPRPTIDPSSSSRGPRRAKK
jgi:ubiquinone/menaquinone biosynthesis C-methylase UbiE